MDLIIKRMSQRISRRLIIQGLLGTSIPLSLGLIGKELIMNLNQTPSTTQMPVLFFAHGSPMLTLENNAFTKMLAKTGENLPIPKFILCISAHWESRGGTWVTGMDHPKTIHDFYGFPDELYAVEYPAPGSPTLAHQIQKEITSPTINIDENKWGLDHGTWTVLRHVYPKANIPVLQLSMDMSQPPEYHYRLGQALASLRKQGVLIIGSGNIVHNLRLVQWGKNAKPAAWAIEFDEWVKERLINRDDKSLVSDFLKTTAGQTSIPTPEHYLPLLYILGAAGPKDQAQFLYEGIDMSALSMRTVLFQG